MSGELTARDVIALEHHDQHCIDYCGAGPCTGPGLLDTYAADRFITVLAAAGLSIVDDGQQQCFVEVPHPAHGWMTKPTRSCPGVADV